MILQENVYQKCRRLVFVPRPGDVVGLEMLGEIESNGGTVNQCLLSICKEQAGSVI